MKGKINKIVSVLLVGCLGLSVFAACGEQPADEEVTKYLYTDGVHDFTAPETDEYLLKNGATEYKIVVPYGCPMEVSLAREELTNFFYQATNVRFSVIYEDATGLTHQANGKYISLGDTKMFESAGLSIDKNELGTDGVRIQTKDKTVYINGGSEMGVLYGVYDFLQIILNFEVYADDCWVIDENVTSLKLRNFDVTDIPDFSMRCNAYGSTRKNVNNIMYRFRQPVSYASFLLPVFEKYDCEGESETIHNTSALINQYSETFCKDMVSDVGPIEDITSGQLCYTAHGKADVYEMMINECVRKYTDALKKYTPDLYPELKMFTLTMEDNFKNCTCKACGEAFQKYGTNSGAVMVFCNDVMEKVVEWMNLPENEAYKRDDLRLMFFAYHSFVDAPTHYDEEQGKYVVNHPDLELRDDVGVYYCLKFSKNVSVYSEDNKDERESARGWFDVAPFTVLWGYEANFRSYAAMCNSFNLFDSEGYQFFAAAKPYAMMNQSNGYDTNETAFYGLKSYLQYKMMWNCTLDEETLIDGWFNAMYREAAPMMKNLFNRERDYVTMLFEQVEDLKGLGHADISEPSLYDPSYWPITELTGQIEICRQALKVIEVKYKGVNDELYKTLKHHIDVEYVSPAFLLLFLHFDNADISAADLQVEIDYFQSILPSLGTMKYMESSEDGSLTNYIKGL